MKRIFVWTLAFTVLFCAGNLFAKGEKIDTPKVPKVAKEKRDIVAQADTQKDKVKSADDAVKEKQAKIKDAAEKEKQKQEAKIKDNQKDAADKVKAEEEGLSKGKNHKQQMEAGSKKMARQEAKHADRVARLQKIREVAVSENDTKTVERVDKLLGKEKTRYGKKAVKMQEQGAKAADKAAQETAE